LLIQTSLYITAQPLSERHPIPAAAMMRLKVAAIGMLNEHLRAAGARCTSDEAMAAVSQFIAIELYYGEPSVMLAHLKG
jgi:hypothetical protein